VLMARAIPKSVTFTPPSSVMRTLPGLMSRWTTPWRWAEASAPRPARRSRRPWSGRAAGLSQHRRKRTAVDELHDDEVRARVLAPVEHRDDVGMGELGGGLGLPAEPLHERPVHRESGKRTFRATGRSSSRSRAGRPRPCRRGRSDGSARSVPRTRGAPRLAAWRSEPTRPRAAPKATARGPVGSSGWVIRGRPRASVLRPARRPWPPGCSSAGRG